MKHYNKEYVDKTSRNIYILENKKSPLLTNKIPEYLKAVPLTNVSPPVESLKQTLPLQELSWEQFESLCWRLLNKEGNQFAYIYGVKGQAQEGIDIYRINDTDERYTTFQCKRVKNYTAKDIKEAINKFLKGDWKKRSSKFVICSSQSFNDSKLRDEIEVQRKTLAEEGIEFDVWDINKLSVQLREHHELIYEFFHEGWMKAFLGERVADSFFKTFGKYNSISLIEKFHYEGPKSYIKRKYIETDTKDEIEDIFGIYSKQELNQILSENVRIIILSEAGNGKTTELDYIGALFSGKELKLFPFKFSLSKYTNEDIENLIPRDYSDLPKRNILFILDGLDEIPSANRNNFIKKLEAFVEINPDTRFIISSRTNFYRTGTAQTSGSIKGFRSFILAKLDGDQIENFIHSNIEKDSIGKFNDEIFRNNLNELMSNPFYLINIVKIYNSNKSIPDRKSRLFEKLIGLSFDFDKEHYRTTEELHENEILLQKCLMKIAVVMELIGKNEINETELQKVIPNHSDRILLKCSSIINKDSDDNYHFVHNNFREYLCARALSSNDFDDIRCVLFVDGQFNQRRLNVFSFLMSIAEKDSVLHKSLLDSISDNDLEVLVNIERDKLSDSERNEIFIRIYEHYKNRSIFLDRNKFNFRTLANFAESNKTLDFVLSEIQTLNNINLKCNLIELVGNFKNLIGRLDEIREILMNQLRIGDYHVRYNCMRTITDLKLNTKELIDETLAILDNSNVDYENAGIYYLISKSEHLDDYVDVFLKGIPNHRFRLDSGSETRIGDEHIYLVNGLEKITSSKALMKLIDHFKENPSDFRDIYFHKFESLLESIVDSYKNDNSLFDSVFELFLTLHSEHVECKELSILDSFFDKTGTSIVAFKKILVSTLEDYKKWDLISKIANLDVVKEIIKMYNDGALSDSEIEKYLWGLRHSNETTRKTHFSKIKGETKYEEKPQEPSPDYDQLRAEGLLDYITLLLNKSDFLKHLNEILEKIGKDEISYKDLSELTNDTFHEGKPYDFLIRDLYRMVRKGGNMKPEDIVNYFKQLNWELYALNEIYKYLSNNWEINLTKEQIDWIRNWCNSNWDKVDFRKELVHYNTSYSVLHIESIYLWFFLKQFSFPFPKGVLLDLLSFDWIKGIKWIGIEYLEQFLSAIEIKNRILENLKSCADTDIAICNQIEYCRKKNFGEINNFLPAIIKDNKREWQTRIIALDAFVSLSGDVVELKKNLVSVDDIRWIIIYKLIEEKNEDLEAELLEIFKVSEGQDKLRAAALLQNYQNEEALSYYVEIVRNGKKIPFIEWSLDYSPYNQIRSIKLLSYVMELLDIAYQRDFVDSEFYSFKSTLFEVLRNIVLDNPLENFPKVKDALEEFIKKFSETIPEVSYIYRTIDDFERQINLSKSEVLDIEDAIKISDKIFPGS